MLDAVPVISAEVFELIAAGCIPGGSRDNLAFANKFTEWDGATQRSEGLVHGCSDERRPSALRARRNAACRFEASEGPPRPFRRHHRPDCACRETANTGSCMKASRLRAIPSVDKLLQSRSAMPGLPRPLVLDQVRREFGALRKQKTIPEFDAVVSTIRAKLRNSALSAAFSL